MGKWPCWERCILEIEKRSREGGLDPIAADRELFSLSLDANPLWADRHRGLDAEARRVRREFPSPLPLSARASNLASTVLNRLDADGWVTERVLAAAGAMEENPGLAMGAMPFDI